MVLLLLITWQRFLKRRPAYQVGRGMVICGIGILDGKRMVLNKTGSLKETSYRMKPFTKHIGIVDVQFRNQCYGGRTR